MLQYPPSQENRNNTDVLARADVDDLVRKGGEEMVRKQQTLSIYPEQNNRVMSADIAVFVWEVAGVEL